VVRLESKLAAEREAWHAAEARAEWSAPDYLGTQMWYNTSPRRQVTHLLHHISLSTVVSTIVDNEGIPRLEVTRT
jgi:hypothetical protein